MVRRGVTLVELLISISILLALTSLVLPALHRSRESSRRLQCTSNLHNIGLATQQFVAVQGEFPDLGTADRGAYVELLPFLEHESLYATWDSLGRFDLALEMPVFRCPSDFLANASHSRYRLGCNYLGNRGDGNWEHARNGLFENRGPIALRKVKDGLSRTALYCEALLGGAGYVQKNRGLVVFPRHSAFNAFRVVCSHAIGNDRIDGAWGSRWFNGSEGVTTYDHALKPNDPSCTMGNYQQMIVTASSQHFGGVLLLLADGKCEFVNDEIDETVWASFGTRSSDH